MYTCSCFGFAPVGAFFLLLLISPSMASDKFRLLFFGSDIFSLKVLDGILSRQIWPVQVVTKPNSLLHHYSKKKNLRQYAWEPGIRSIDQSVFNIGLVASFGAMIDIETITRFQYGLFNVHPSLLPTFRGSTPVQAAILNGLRETGCTIMRIPPVEKFDIGDIVLQQKLLVHEDEYARDLMLRLADLGSEMSSRLLLDFENSIRHLVPQSDARKSYAKKLKPEMGLLSFRTESSTLIGRKVRAYTGFIHLYTTCWGGMRCRLSNMRNQAEVATYRLDKLASCDQKAQPGRVFFHKVRKTLCIKCNDGQWLAFDRISPPNKRMMNALDFYNGYMAKKDPRTHMTDV